MEIDRIKTAQINKLQKQLKEIVGEDFVGKDLDPSSNLGS